MATKKKPPKEQEQLVESKSGSGGPRGKLQKIGALWLKTGANGKFMSGTMNLDDDNPNRVVMVLVFRNRYKELPKHPDYVVYARVDELEKVQHGAETSDDNVPF